MTESPPLTLVRPGLGHLPDHVAARERAWSADNLRGAAAARDEPAQITTDPDNLASQKLILGNRGVLVASFDKDAALGHAPGLRLRIVLGITT